MVVPGSVNVGHLTVSSLHMSVTTVLQRSMTVKVKAQDENGAKVSLSLTDFQARIFQHEYDHLQVGSLVAWSVDDLMSHLRNLANAIMNVHTLPDLARIAMCHPDAKLGGLLSIDGGCNAPCHILLAVPKLTMLNI